MEVSGFEPPTSSLRTKRSSQLSYTPEGKRGSYRVVSEATSPSAEIPKVRRWRAVTGSMMLRAPLRRPVRRASVVAVLLALVVLMVGCTPEQEAVRGHVNGSRRAAGVAELLPDSNINAKAQAWAEHLARAGRLEHSNVADGLVPGWRKLGENVGRGPSLESVHNGFLRSPAHRANLLDGSWTQMGTGVAVAADGMVYVVQVFAAY